MRHITDMHGQGQDREIPEPGLGDLGRETGGSGTRPYRHSVFISQGCNNKVPQAWRLTITEVYYLTVLEARSPHAKCWQGGHAPSEPGRGGCFCLVLVSGGLLALLSVPLAGRCPSLQPSVCTQCSPCVSVLTHMLLIRIPVTLDQGATLLQRLHLNHYTSP